MIEIRYPLSKTQEEVMLLLHAFALNNDAAEDGDTDH